MNTRGGIARKIDQLSRSIDSLNYSRYEKNIEKYF